jgi:hypothetical protein
MKPTANTQNNVILPKLCHGNGTGDDRSDMIYILANFHKSRLIYLCNKSLIMWKIILPGRDYVVCPMHTKHVRHILKWGLFFGVISELFIYDNMTFHWSGDKGFAAAVMPGYHQVCDSNISI